MLFPIFGASPSGTRAERINRSPNFRDGSFQNLTPTEVTLPDASFVKMLVQFFTKPADIKPPRKLPSVKTDLKSLADTVPAVVWFGHSSYYIKFRGISILVDPVFSGNASPVSFFGKSFDGSDVYGPEDFGDIDILIITHDHYDHLDYKTIAALAPRVKLCCTSLGVGSHLELWGIPAGKLVELDWWEEATVAPGVSVTATPARHFSGRLFKRGQTLWSSFVIKLPGYTLFAGGDSGYGEHFKVIGEKFGPFDLALLETGQYGDAWPYIHTTPEEMVQAGADLRARVLMPVHWAKFVLANHGWKEPVIRAEQAAKNMQMPMTTPMIGEPVVVGSDYPVSRWWDF